MTYFLSLRLLTISLILILLAFLPSAAQGQQRSYTNRSLDYVLDLPSAKWRVIKVPGVAHASTEFRYGQKSPVHLRIRRELVDAGVSPADMVQRKQRFDRLSLRGYVKSTVEPFEGRLSGAKYAYEYVTAGKPTAVLIYYLHANNRFIYRVEFVGPLNELQALAEQTDFICAKLPHEIAEA
jgi:hypothetical protein